MLAVATRNTRIWVTSLPPENAVVIIQRRTAIIARSTAGYSKVNEDNTKGIALDMSNILSQFLELAIRKGDKSMSRTPLTDAEVVAEHHDVELMRRLHLWPYGCFLPLKHRRAVDLHGIRRTAILYYSNPETKQKPTYIFLPGVNMYSIPDEFWTDSTGYRTGGETLLFGLIMEGWIVQ